ncbi:hypothetical protein L596_026185 [Steinernema carpocapsae]|uniref:RING-type domain-containing protein n=1 Tax=Steinernema carpocapsae TaxID=34508 RepID=A0A4U5M0M0_STECR|nr:hypothetical protein L596_026185 [Steinernema carpocapsae]
METVQRIDCPNADQKTFSLGAQLCVTDNKVYATYWNSSEVFAYNRLTQQNEEMLCPTENTNCYWRFANETVFHFCYEEDRWNAYKMTQDCNGQIDFRLLFERISGRLYGNQFLSCTNDDKKRLYSLATEKFYNVPDKAFKNSFLYNDRIYMVVRDSEKLEFYSFAVSDHISQIARFDFEVGVAEIPGLSFETKIAVIGHCVFFLQVWNGNLNCFKLDMRTECAQKLPLTQKAIGTSVSGTKLYFTDGTRETLWAIDLLPYASETQSSEHQLLQFECPVCFELASKPKVFPCGHLICSGCEVKITVVDQLHHLKTIVCPRCCESFNLPVAKKLPVFGDLQGSTPRKPLNTTADSVRCISCKDTVPKNRAFHCDYCARNLQKVDFLLCGTCAFEYHVKHSESVKKAEFATETEKRELLKGILSELEEVTHEKNTTITEVTSKLQKKIVSHYEGMEKVVKVIEERVKKVKENVLITKNALDAEAEKLKDQQLAIQQKKAEIAEWKNDLLEKLE